MKQSKREKVQSLLYTLRRQYPDGCCTFSRCKQCENSARGGGLCADCLATEISDTIGEVVMTGSLANKYHKAFVKARELETKILEMCEESR